LAALKDGQLNEILTRSLHADAAPLRAAALRFAAKANPAEAPKLLETALANGTIVEKQAAIGALADLKGDGIDKLLFDWLIRSMDGKAPPEIQLELSDALNAPSRTMAASLQAAAERNARVKLFAPEHLAPWRETLYGGDAEHGRDIFLNRAEVSCVRCHKLNGTGGDVGPELAGIGGKQTREYLLESLVLPDKQIAKGFDTVVLELANGKTVTGVLKSEDAKEIKLITPEGQSMTVAKAQIEERRRGKSAMPEDLHQKLTKREIRDLV